MGNSVNQAVRYLGDPYLVRRIQEKFGVKQIIAASSASGEGDGDGLSSDSDSQPPSLASSGAVSSPGSSIRERSDGKAGSLDANSAESSKHAANGTANGGSGFVNGSIEWLTTKAKKKRRIPSLTPTPDITPASSPPPSPESKTAPPLPDIIIESVPLFDVYFRLATELGYEPFYITVIPFIFWNIDTVPTRHAIILWCLSMYVGQACKVLFKIKRPASPPALRLEINPNLETEYGFPSTHAIVSTVIPFYFFYCCVLMGRYQMSFWVGLLIALTWSASVCVSRVYLGVHTVLDILGGIIISVIVVGATIPILRTLDQVMLYGGQYYSVGALLLVAFMLYIYPVERNKWSMDRADTAAILGVGLGVTAAFNVHGPYPDDLLPEPITFSYFSLRLLWVSLTRFVVGILLLVPTRFLMKLLCFKLLPTIMPTHGVAEEVRRPLVELPYKIITYGAIGFNAVYLAPILFEICDISRW